MSVTFLHQLWRRSLRYPSAPFLPHARRHESAPFPFDRIPSRRSAITAQFPARPVPPTTERPSVVVLVEDTNEFRAPCAAPWSESFRSLLPPEGFGLAVFRLDTLATAARTEALRRNVLERYARTAMSDLKKLGEPDVVRSGGAPTSRCAHIF
mmetsp:Transcript_30816/g.47659  ORF Transcript_30816/g.47659 Transcript_30816/m.47659 type:complete len:153 (-) Transcript_30816:18-476(-)